MRRGRIVTASIIVGLLAGWGSSALLGAASAAGSPAAPAVTVTPTPTVPPLGLRARIGVKMYPQDYGFARNPEATHRLGEWYTLEGDIEFPTFGARLTTGRYLVWFPGRLSRGTITVAATPTDGQRCETVEWGPSPAEYPGIDVELACSAASGAPANAQFTITYRNP